MLVQNAAPYSKQPPRPWQQWCSEVFEPAILDHFDQKKEDERTMRMALLEIAAAAFEAGHRYGFERRVNPNLE